MNEEKEIFRDIYNLLIKYNNPQDTEEYWKEVIHQLGLLSNKHRNHYLITQMSVLLCNYLEYKMLHYMKQQARH